MSRKIKEDLEVRINKMLEAYKAERISLDNATETIISLLKIREDGVPMGVSQWRNHGMKYHYFDYFMELAEKQRWFKKWSNLSDGGSKLKGDGYDEAIEDVKRMFNQ